MKAHIRLNWRLTATALFAVYMCLVVNTYAEGVDVNIKAVIEDFDATPNSFPSQTVNSQPNHMQSYDQDDPFISENSGSKPVFKPVPGGGFGGPGNNSNFGGYAPPAQYTPSALDQVHKDYMPGLMPGWGPYGDEYPIEGDPKWTSRRYYVPQGDVIIAINDRRIRSLKDYQTAMVRAGRYAVLTIASHHYKGSVYCMCVRVRNHRLPLGVADSFYGDDIADAVGGLATLIINKNVKNKKDKVEYKPKERVKGAYINKCFSDFEGYLYKPGCPFPLDDE